MGRPSHDRATLVCHFWQTGFRFEEGGWARPCGVWYHVGCFRAGPPFVSRRRNQAGLSFPPVKQWPLFVCEACTVRAVLGRELHGVRDAALLQLERMRILDLAHSWSEGTHTAYQQKLGFLGSFEKLFHGLQLLPIAKLPKPPSGPDVRLMWAAKAYCLKPGREPDSTVTFGTVRSLRSAASYYHTIAMLPTHDGGLLLDRQQRLIEARVRPTDGAGHTYFIRGLRSRIGDNPKPSFALLHRQVVWFDNYFRQAARNSDTVADRVYWTRAAVANLLFWLGWLRSQEVFDLVWSQVVVIPPSHGPRHDLPRGCGAIMVTLAPETKSNRVSAADVAIACRTYTGFGLGPLVLRLAALDNRQPVDHRPIFRTLDGQRWTSRYFRDEFLYPLLLAQQPTDPYLRPFSSEALLRAKFWSLHCYRRGARSHVSRRHRTLGTRAGSPDEVYEHARWRRSRSGEPVDVIYRQWTLRDRLRLTQFCM